MFTALHLEIAQTLAAERQHERERASRRFHFFSRRECTVETGAPTPPPAAVVLEHPALREHRVRRQLVA